MFRLLGGLISFAVVVAVAVGVLYFLPHDIKMKALEVIENIAPESIKNKAEDLILTPSEEREKIIGELEEKLETLKNSKSAEAVEEAIEKSKAALEELKEKNDELSIGEIVKTKIVEWALRGDDTLQCPKPEEKTADGFPL